MDDRGGIKLWNRERKEGEKEDEVKAVSVTGWRGSFTRRNFRNRTKTTSAYVSPRKMFNSDTIEVCCLHEETPCLYYIDPP
jgi:hypothetical protein